MIDKNQVRSMILDVVNGLKKQGLAEYDTDTSRIVKDTLKKLRINKAIIGLNTRGCSYGNNMNGCFNCGYLKSYEHPDRMYQQFLEDAGHYACSDNVSLYSNGSFFDPKEIPPEIQKKMLEHLLDLGVKQITVETRPDLIDETNLSYLLDSVPARYLKVGLGFDTYNDDIRDVCLNKGFTRHQYDDAFRILNKNNIHFESRIVVKPPFLTEDEAIKEALLSVKYAFNKGSSEVSLEPISIQDYTLQDYLAKKGFFKVPWLWSAISIVKETHDKGTVLVGGEAFVPLPKETACNCNKCTAIVRQVVNKFNETQDIRLFDDLDCDCIIDWRKDLDVKEIPLFDRIIKQVSERRSIL